MPVSSPSFFSRLQVGSVLGRRGQDRRFGGSRALLCIGRYWRLFVHGQRSKHHDPSIAPRLVFCDRVCASQISASLKRTTSSAALPKAPLPVASCANSPVVDTRPRPAFIILDSWQSSTIQPACSECVEPIRLNL